jgi:hypothetical protein
VEFAFNFDVAHDQFFLRSTQLLGMPLRWQTFRRSHKDDSSARVEAHNYVHVDGVKLKSYWE